MKEEATSATIAAVSRLAEQIRSNIERVIVGKGEVIDLLLVALFSDGHVLIEDVPGMGKTTLAKALARSLGMSFQRIQGTPDLLPTDLTGLTYFDQKRSEFLFRPGPLFAQLVLVDEINRATPRTQAALLEAMAERQVTIERETLALPQPYLVLATQNPVELEGTFPLPVAQLDRFLLRVPLGYPSEEEELTMLHRFKTADPEEPEPPDLTALRRLYRAWLALLAAQHPRAGRQPAETPTEYAARLQRALHSREKPWSATLSEQEAQELASFSEQLTQTYLLERYGARPTAPAEQVRLAACFQRCAQQLQHDHARPTREQHHQR